MPMLKTIRIAALVGLVGFGALAALPAAAQADGLYLNFGGRDDSRVGVYSGDRDDGVRHWHRDRKHADRGRRHRKERWQRRERNQCSPGHALDKAERMGLHRARVVDVNRRTIRVAGRKFNNRVTVMFANERGCPIAIR